MIELIFNPIAGHGRSLRALNLVKQELDLRQIDHHTSETDAPGHATELTRMAIERGATAVAVLGGDGLLSEVCAALNGSDVALFFVPCGTGNDFIKTMRLPGDPLKALRLQLDSPRRRIDCGMVNDHTFLNIAGVGFDIEVLQQTERFKARLNGIWPYLCGLFVGLKNYVPLEAEVTLDGVSEHGKYTLISVANGRCFGGGMRVAPLADPADGAFDVMLVDMLPKWKFYCAVPLFLFGLHIKFAFTRRVLAKDVVIRMDKPFIVEADGELKQVEHARFALQAKGISVSCP